MARVRDYKREYQQALARAKSRGYASERAYKKATRTREIAPIRGYAKKRQAQWWSDRHSIQPNSRFEPQRAEEFDMEEDEYVDAYWRAFVAKRHKNEENEWDLNDLWEYLTDVTGYYDDNDIQERYKGGE